jgi:hypothetical protein
MSESTSPAAGTGGPRPARAFDWGALAGLGFVVLYILLIVIDPGVDPSEKDAPAELRKWLDDAETGMYLVLGSMAVAAIAMLVAFVHRLDRLLADAGVPDGNLRATARAAGWVYAVSEHALMPLLGMSQALWAFAITAGGVVILCVGLAAKPAKALPVWLTWATLVIGVLCVLAVPLMGLPTPLFALWIVVTAVMLLLPRRAAA